MGESAELDILVKTIAGGTGAKETASDLKKFQEQAGKSNDAMAKGATQANASFLQVNKSVQAVGKSIMAIGAVSMVAMVNSAKQYVANMQGADATSRQWLQAQYDIADAQNRIGKDVATVMLPAYKELAKLAGQIADFLDKHPGVTTAGVVTAGAASVVAAGYGAVQTYKIAGALSTLAAGGGVAAKAASTAAETAGAYGVAGGLIGPAEGAAVATAVAKPGIMATLGKGAASVLKSPLFGVLGSVAGGLVAGGNIANYLASTPMGQKAGVATWQQGVTVGSKGIGEGAGFLANIIPDVQKYGLSIKAVQEAQKQAETVGNSWGVDIGRLTGAIPKAADATDDFAGTTQQLAAALSKRRSDEQAELAFSVQVSHMQRDYAIQQVYATQDFHLQQTRAQRDFDIQQGYAQDDFNLQRQRSDRDFGIQMLYSQQDYQLQTLISTRDFNLQMARSNADYQLSVSRNAQDHAFDMQQLALGGDAMSMWLAERQYNLQKQRAEEDHNTQQSRAQQDFNTQQADAAAQGELLPGAAGASTGTRTKRCAKRWSAVTQSAS